jgi:hypothetical protein
MIWIAWYDSHSSILLFSMDMLDCFNWFLSFYSDLLFFLVTVVFQHDVEAVCVIDFS